MKKFRVLSRTLIKSFTPRYYPDIIAAPLSFSLKFLFALIGFFSLITSASVSLPLAFVNPKASIDSIVSLYPKDLTITVEKGRLTINQPLPFTVTAPDPSHQPLVVFDSDARLGPASNVRDYQAPIVITESTLYFHDSTKNEIRANPIPTDLPKISVSPTTINTISQQILANPLIRYRLYSVIIFIFLLIALFLGLSFASLLTTFFFSLIAYLISLVFARHLGLSFAKIFQISIHSLVIIYLANFLLGFLGASISFPLIFFTYLAFTFWGLSYYHPTPKHT